MNSRWSVRLAAWLCVLAFAFSAQPSSGAGERQLMLRVETATAIPAPQPDLEGPQPYLSIRLSPDTAKDLRAFTARHVGHLVESVIDGKAVGRFVIRVPVTSPVIQLPFAGGIKDAIEAAQRLSRQESNLVLRTAQ